jgi:hypothetical protein
VDVAMIMKIHLIVKEDVAYKADYKIVLDMSLSYDCVGTWRHFESKEQRTVTRPTDAKYFLQVIEFFHSAMKQA